MRRARAFAFMSALILAAPAALAQAQGRWGPPVTSTYSRVGYDEGYRRGEQFGVDDGRRGSAFNFIIANDYRRADVGYRSQYGARDQYRNDFRAGFEAGYRNGYARYERGTNGRGRGRGNAGSGYGYGGFTSDLASSNGYADGFEEGMNDGRKRHTNDPRDESRYDDGDRGYERFYGARELYRANYRRAFIDGYEAGYRDGWSYR